MTGRSSDPGWSRRSLGWSVTVPMSSWPVVTVFTLVTRAWLHHALLLAGQHVRRHRGTHTVVLVVTDGEPTAPWNATARRC